MAIVRTTNHFLMRFSLAATVLLTVVWAVPAVIPDTKDSAIANRAHSGIDKPENAENIEVKQETKETKETKETTEANQAERQEKQKEHKDLLEVSLPAELTVGTFDEFTSAHVALVEFYSPYCSHCKQLAPKWKAAYQDLQQRHPDLPIHMRQVNCIESGDLCHRETITGYPDMRVYVPAKDAAGVPIEGKLRYADLYPRGLARTAENIAKFMIRLAAEYDTGTIDLPSALVEADVDLGMNLAAGEIDAPYFVVFAGADSGHWDKDAFPATCYDCLEHKQVWTKLSNLLISSTRTAHINCLAHPTLCAKMGFPELAITHTGHLPRYAMFLPKAAGLVRVDYRGEPKLAEMQRFAEKISASSRYEHVAPKTLMLAEVLRTKLAPEPVDPYFPLVQKAVLLYAYDPKVVAKEDKAILPYLLDQVARLPFDIDLYVTQDKGIPEALKLQAEGLLQYVASDETFAPHTFNPRMFHATTLTALPTLYVFKENLLVPAVYQNFAVEDMRDAEKIAQFVDKNAHPLVGELTPEVFAAYFHKHGRKNLLKDDRVVVTLLDTTNANHVRDTLHSMSMAAHQYHLLRQEYYYAQVVAQRDAKEKRVEQKKQLGADSAEVVEEMRGEVPHLFDHDDVLFAFVDMHRYPDWPALLGWDVDRRGYKAGDAVVVSKTSRFYWDLNLQGEQLRMEPEKVREVLQYLLDPAAVETKPTGFAPKLVGSPFPRYLRVADVVHKHGFLGYLVFVLSVFLVNVFVKAYARRRRETGRQGIIGVTKSD